MNILITGATGFIGTKLLQALINEGHTVSIVTRNVPKAQKTVWSISQAISCLAWDDITKKKLEGIECVINLAGASIATFPRNKKNKKRIYDSRILTTKKIVACLPKSCTTLLSASAIGYYPSHEEKLYTTSYTNTAPQSFMEQVCIDREAEAYKAQNTNRRIITLRSGLVLGKEKIGYLMEAVTKYLGGIILGTGNQRMSLITVEERVANCITLINNTHITGPVNMVSHHIQHKDYIHALAKSLQRPVWWIKAPSFLIRLCLGEMAALVLDSQKVEPFKHG